MCILHMEQGGRVEQSLINVHVVILTAYVTISKL